MDDQRADREGGGSIADGEPNWISLRKELRAFLGNIRFRKFVRQAFRTRGNRLLYWQELKWEKFIASKPRFAVSMDELAIALRICDLHNLELLHETRVLYQGCVDFANEYIEATLRLFPFAMGGPISTEGAPYDGAPIDVWYCPACRQAAAEWRKNNFPTT